MGHKQEGRRKIRWMDCIDEDNFFLSYQLENYLNIKYVYTERTIKPGVLLSCGNTEFLSFLTKILIIPDINANQCCFLLPSETEKLHSSTLEDRITGAIFFCGFSFAFA